MNEGSWTRRTFLKRVGAGILGLATYGNVLGDEKDSSKPNVILILTDDQGTIDVNCFGSKDLHTPNLDALAKRGTRFTQFYVGAPVCSPSRACLLTGRYPQRAELVGNAGYRRKGMPPRQVTIAEMLKAHGYRTGIFGKWHLGTPPALSPLAQGFDEFLGHKGGCIDNYSHFFYWSGPNRHDMWRNDEENWEDQGKYFPDMIEREAHRFIEANKDRPFFMYLPFNVPHYPMQAQAKYREMYAETKQPRKRYAAFVSTVDEKIGKVIDKIDQLGLRGRTIVIFLSDNGHSVEERGFFGGGSAGSYRGYKGTLWEGGIRLPCIVSWPGHIPEGQVRNQIVMSMDWMPTIAHYCGAQLPERKIDGKNIASIISSNETASPHKVTHWEYYKHWAVRDGDWKLVADGPSTEYKGRIIPQVEFFLSNLAEDATETENLATKRPDIVKRLTEIHNKWVDEVQQQ